MDNKQIKGMIATGYVLEEQVTMVIDDLSDSIARTFSTLANLNPEAAMHVMRELNSQLTQEKADLVTESREARIESIAAATNLESLLD